MSEPSRDATTMLLARPGQFNAALRRGSFLVLGLLVAASSVPADEIRRWRDADGTLHVEIVGGGEPVDPDGAGMPLLSTTELSPDEKFSVAASHRRRAMERGLVAASAELARLKAAIEKSEAEEFVVYTPPTASSPAEAQFLLDAQRNAFLAAQRFRQDRDDRLRKLRRERRRELLGLRDLWKGFEGLREEVRERYGKPPGWWRDRLECDGCLTAAEVEAALKPAEEPDEPKEAEEPKEPNDGAASG